MKKRIMTAMAVVAMTSVFNTYGTINYWDNNGSNDGFGSADGTWGVDGNWSGNSAGTSVPTVTNTTAADDLHFGTATKGLQTGTITVDSTSQSFKTMTFGAASGAIILSGGTLNLAAPASTVIVNNSSNTIGSVLAGVNGLQTEITAASVLTLTGTNTYSGSTTIDSGTLQIDGGGQLGSGSYTGAITNDGQLLYSSTADQTLSGAISGSGSLGMSGKSGGMSCYVTNTTTLSATFQDVFFNVSLSDCIGAEGYLGGNAINGGIPVQATTFFFENDGTNATCQFQIFVDSRTKCAKVAFTQNGVNIAARKVYAKYSDYGENIVGFDFDTGGTETTAYLVTQTTVNLLRQSLLTLSGTNSYTGGTTVNGGIIEATTTASALPSSGGITVNGGGELRLNVPGMSATNPGGIGYGNPITVNSGGLLTLADRFNTGYSRSITINGGTLNSIVLSLDDNGNYMNNLTLMNGAQVTGYKIRVGNLSDASIVVSGTNACTIPAGINMVNKLERPLTLNVADVTGDSAADLTIPGEIRDYNDTFDNMPIVKTGAGTVSISGANTHIGVININEGTLALDGAGSLNTDNPIVLNGGTLDMGDYANTVGTLTVSDSNSAIVLGAGSIAFADSSATTWVGTLTITGDLGAQSVRFGTANTALTSTQLGSITVNDGGALLTENGYLLYKARAGTIIVLR